MPSPDYAYITHRQDNYSGALIRAVCAAAGCSVDAMTLDNDKIDYIVKSRVRGSIRTKPQIDIQAKCQLRNVVTEDEISYQIDAETYNSLKDPLVSNPRILVLLVAPVLNPEVDDDPSLWITQSDAQSVLKHCAYWISLKGLPDITTDNKTLHIPKLNIFTPMALRAMMVKASNGVDL